MECFKYSNGILQTPEGIFKKDLSRFKIKNKNKILKY